MDYSKADLEPRKACDALGRFQSKDIAQITATVVPAAAATPAHCRVTGVLSPEIAFEVSLPAKWNGRFYMIGNGGHAGESLEDAGRVAQRNQALQLGFAFAQTNTGHDARKEPGGSFVMSNPQKADRLRLPRGAPHGGHVEGHHQGLLRPRRVEVVLELVLQRRPPGPDRGPALPRGLRRHRRQRAVGRSDRLHDRGDVEPAGAHRHAGRPPPRWPRWRTR